MSAGVADARSQALALARATAAVLSLGAWLAVLPAVVTVCALWRVASDAAWRGTWLVDVVLGAGALYYALRVRLDQRLFDGVAGALARGASEADALAALDTALATLGLRKVGVAARTLAERTQRTMRLLRLQVVLAVVQLVLALALLLFS